MNLIDIPKLLFTYFSTMNPKSLHPSHGMGICLAGEFKNTPPWWLVYEDNRPHHRDKLRRGHLKTHSCLHILSSEEKCKYEEDRDQSLLLEVGRSGDVQYGGIRFIPGQRGFDHLDPRDPHWPALLELLEMWHELTRSSEDNGPYRILSEHDAELTVRNFKAPPGT